MTTQATHTPGPWAALMQDPPTIADRRGCRVATSCALPGQWAEEQQANARLIAAAPDLLAALRAIAGMKCDGDLWHGNEDGENVTNDETHDALVDALCIAREAIAQMEGAQ